MKNMQFKIVTSLFVLAFLTHSCEKTIEVDLNESDPLVVIEAHLCEGVQDFYVRVSKTTSYFNTQKVEPVDQATVKLAVDSVQWHTLVRDSAGVYFLPAFEARAQSTYTLWVEIDGVSYRATAYMPNSPDVGTITYAQDEGPGVQGDYSIIYEFPDRVGEQNQYRFVLSKNHEVLVGGDNIFLGTDENNDGENVKVRFRNVAYDRADTVTIQARSMDENVHLYYRTLKDIVAGASQNNSAPSNPVSNFNNGALGCFDVYSKAETSIVLPQ